jgi:putative ATPase
MNRPLADIIRPKTLEEFIGQNHLVSNGSVLRMMIEKDKFRSMIFWGPSGTGKTTLAEIIASKTKAEFVKLNATNAGIKNVRTSVDAARVAYDINGVRTIVMIDEIHRFSKNIQDALLPHVENGTIILIGATTENPFFSVNGSLVSRSMIFEFEPMTQKDILQSIKRGLEYYRLNNINVKIEKDAALYLSKMSNGDIRRAITALEFAVESIDEPIKVTLDICRQIMPRKYSVVSRDTAVYDTLSAIQGSIQASDVHGAIFWLGQAINHGEDLATICRRLLVTASEDVGCSNPMAAVHTYSCVQSALMTGLPEAKIILSACVSYLAMNPRSKSAIKAINKAINLDLGSDIRIPNYLADCHYEGAKEVGRGEYMDGGNMNIYHKFPFEIFSPTCGEECDLMKYNDELWEDRDQK